MLARSNVEIAQSLRRVAELLAREDAHAQLITAYRQAAERIAHCGRPLDQLIDDDGVEGLRQLGLPYEVAGTVADWLRAGHFALLQRLEERHQPECELRQVPGIGPRLARQVHCTLGVDNLDELGAVARDGRLARVCGFGARRVALVNCALSRHVHRRARRAPVEQLALDIDE